MGDARSRRHAASADGGISSYRGMRALIALLVALLALFCLVIVAQSPLATALRALRHDHPASLSPGLALILGATVITPLIAGALAYLLTALAIPLLRIGLYTRRLHQAVGRELSLAPLVALGLDLRAVRFSDDGKHGERDSLSETLAAPTHLLLIGESGTGKTTALRRLAAHATRRRNILAFGAGRPLPVLLSLAELSTQVEGPASLDQLVLRAAEPFATRGLLASMPHRLRMGRLLLLCDELEALPATQRAAIGQALAAFVKSGGMLVATCRLDAYSRQPGALRTLEHVPRVVLEGADPDAIMTTLRRLRTAGGAGWRERAMIALLRAHHLDLWSALPAHLAELYTMGREFGGEQLPFGRARATALYLETVARQSPAGDDLSRTLGALASSLLMARQPALPLPHGMRLGSALERWLAAHPPLPRTDPTIAALTAERLEAAARAALTVGLLHLSADGATLSFAHGVLQVQYAAYALASGDDGFGWPAPELLAEEWVLPVILWSGLRDEPVDVTRRLLRLADTPDTTALRAGLTLRAEVVPAIFALAIAALTDALAARLAEVSGTERERATTAQAEQQLRDLLDRVQVMLADAANVPRLASALRLVERRAGPELTEALGFLVSHPPLSRLLRGEIATLLGLLATPRALDIVISLLADSDPLTLQAVIQAVEWAGAPAVATLERALATSDADDRVRRRVGDVLARFGPAAEEHALAAIRAASPTRRLVATRTLAGIASPQAEEALIERLADPDADVRRAAAAALGQLSTPGALSALMRLLTDRDPQLRIVVAGALGASGEGTALAGLLRLLEDEDPQVRAAAVAALGILGGERAIEAIQTRRDDPDPWVRNAVSQALQHRGEY